MSDEDVIEDDEESQDSDESESPAVPATPKPSSPPPPKGLQWEAEPQPVATTEVPPPAGLEWDGPAKQHPEPDTSKMTFGSLPKDRVSTFKPPAPRGDEMFSDTIENQPVQSEAEAALKHLPPTPGTLPYSQTPLSPASKAALAQTPKDQTELAGLPPGQNATTSGPGLTLQPAIDAGRSLAEGLGRQASTAASVVHQIPGVSDLMDLGAAANKVGGDFLSRGLQPAVEMGRDIATQNLGGGDMARGAVETGGEIVKQLVTDPVFAGMVVSGEAWPKVGQSLLALFMARGAKDGAQKVIDASSRWHEMDQKERGGALAEIAADGLMVLGPLAGMARGALGEEAGRLRGIREEAEAPPPATEGRVAALGELGLQPDADPATIRKAWLDRVRATHPDSSPIPGGDPEAFRRTQAAWRFLQKNPAETGPRGPVPAKSWQEHLDEFLTHPIDKVKEMFRRDVQATAGQETPAPAPGAPPDGMQWESGSKPEGPKPEAVQALLKAWKESPPTDLTLQERADLKKNPITTAEAEEALKEEQNAPAAPAQVPVGPDQQQAPAGGGQQLERPANEPAVGGAEASGHGQAAAPNEGLPGAEPNAAVAGGNAEPGAAGRRTGRGSKAAGRPVADTRAKIPLNEIDDLETHREAYYASKEGRSLSDEDRASQDAAALRWADANDSTEEEYFRQLNMRGRARAAFEGPPAEAGRNPVGGDIIGALERGPGVHLRGAAPPPDRPYGIQQLASRIADGFKTDGVVSLVGLRADSPKSLAVVAQVVRHPGVETLRVTAHKTGEIVGEATFEMGLPGAASFAGSTREAARAITQWLESKGADQWAFIHNHPPADPTPSASDVHLTKRFLEAVPKEWADRFMGHVVIDHKAFGLIRYVDGNFERSMHALPEGTVQPRVHAPLAPEHETALGSDEDWTSLARVAQYSKTLRRPDALTLIYTQGTGPTNRSIVTPGGMISEHGRHLRMNPEEELKNRLVLAETIPGASMTRANAHGIGSEILKSMSGSGAHDVIVVGPANLSLDQRAALKSLVEQGVVAAVALDDGKLTLRPAWFAPYVPGLRAGEQLPEPKETFSAQRKKFTELKDNENYLGRPALLRGAPKELTTVLQHRGIVSKLTSLAKAGEIGKYWYEDCSRHVLDMMAGDKDDADKYSQLLGIFSATTPVEPNWRAAARAWAQWKAGEPIKSGKYTRMDREASDLLYHGIQWKGRKRSNFYNNLMVHIDPSRVQGATIDIHMMRALTHTKDAPTDAQYDWAERVAGESAKKLGWAPHQVQAAAWTTQRYLHGGRWPTPYEQWVASGKRGKKPKINTYDFTHAAKENEGAINFETVPPELDNLSDAKKQEFHRESLDLWDYEAAARRMGLLVGDVNHLPGYWSGGSNPAISMRVQMPQPMGATPKEPPHVIDPTQEKLLRRFAAEAGYIWNQKATSYGRSFEPKKGDHGNESYFRLSRQLTPEEVVRFGSALDASPLGGPPENPKAWWQPTSDGFRIVLNPETEAAASQLKARLRNKQVDAYHQQMRELVERELPDDLAVDRSVGRYYGGLLEEGDVNGEGYRNLLRGYEGEEPGLVEHDRQLREAHRALIDRYLGEAAGAAGAEDPAHENPEDAEGLREVPAAEGPEAGEEQHDQGGRRLTAEAGQGEEREPTAEPRGERRDPREAEGQLGVEAQRRRLAPEEPEEEKAEAPEEPLFFSALARAINHIDFKTMPGKDLLARLRSTPGLKPEEIDWLDLPQFLEGKDRVSKEEVQKYIAEHEVQIKPVVRGETAADDTKRAAKERDAKLAKGRLQRTLKKGLTDLQMRGIAADEAAGVQTRWTRDQVPHNAARAIARLMNGSVASVNNENLTSATWVTHPTPINWQQWKEVGDRQHKQLASLVLGGGDDILTKDMPDEHRPAIREALEDYFEAERRVAALTEGRGKPKEKMDVRYPGYMTPKGPAENYREVTLAYANPKKPFVNLEGEIAAWEARRDVKVAERMRDAVTIRENKEAPNDERYIAEVGSPYARATFERRAAMVKVTRDADPDNDFRYTAIIPDDPQGHEGFKHSQIKEVARSYQGALLQALDTLKQKLGVHEVGVGDTEASARDGAEGYLRRRVEAEMNSEGDPMPEEKPVPIYRSSHWNEPNVLAHLRYDERLGRKGEKLLHVGEFQSDWHQTGREYGYGDDDRTREKELEKRKEADEQRRSDLLDRVVDIAQAHGNFGESIADYKPRSEIADRIEKYIGPQSKYAREGDVEWREKFAKQIVDNVTPDELAVIKEFVDASADAEAAREEAGIAATERRKAVPNAPFKKSWHMLALKYALRKAVATGKDKLTWSRGEYNADAYGGLRETIGSLTWEEMPEPGTGHLLVGGTNVDRYIPQASIKAYVGKDLADQLLAATPTTNPVTGRKTYRLASDEIKEGAKEAGGGKGMANWYNQTLPNEFGKYVKPYGGRVEESHVRGPAAESLYVPGETKISREDLRELTPEEKQILFKKWDDERRQTPSLPDFWSIPNTTNPESQPQHYSASNALGRFGAYRSGSGPSQDLYTSAHGAQLAVLTPKALARLKAEAEEKSWLPVHSIAITPEMREAFGKPQPLFAQRKKLGEPAPEESRGGWEDSEAGYGPAEERNFGVEDSGTRSDMQDGFGNIEPAGVEAQRKQLGSPEFKKWFGDSKVVDEHGAPLVVYHGTTHTFDVFDRGHADPESDMGAAFYFSNTPEEVGSNYANDKGPDLTNRIENLAERIFSDREGMSSHGSDQYDDKKEMEEARALARKQLGVEHGGAVVPVYLRLEKPFEIGGRRETRLGVDEHYDEETDEYGEPTGKLVDFIENLKAAVDDLGEERSDGSLKTLIPKIGEHALDDQGLYATDLVKLAREDEEFTSLSDQNGDTISNEIFRQALERTGFDGIIDRSVDLKFGSQRRLDAMRLPGLDGMNPDTVHYIAFKPNQIKSAIGNSGAFDPSDPSIVRAQRHEFSAPGAAAVKAMPNAPPAPAFVAPAVPDPKWSRTMGETLLRSRLGEAAHRLDVELAAVKEFRDEFDHPNLAKPSPEIEAIAASHDKGNPKLAKGIRDHALQIDFIDRIERGVAQGDAKLDPWAEHFKTMFELRKQELVAEGMEAAREWHLNYFPRLWEDPKGGTAEEVIAKVMGRTPMQGGKSFAKHRTFPTFLEGLQHGLTPVSWNPVDVALLKAREMDRFIIARRFMSDLAGYGLRPFQRLGPQNKIEGFRAPKDSMFNVYKSPEIPVHEAFDQKLMEQLEAVAKGLGAAIKTKTSGLGRGKGGGRPWGLTEGDEITRRFGGPEFVLTHEIGHVIQDQYDVYRAITKKLGVKGELHELGTYRFGQDPATSDRFKSYVDSPDEQIANLIHAIVHTPELAKKVAPRATALFKEFAMAHPEIRPLLDVKPSLRLGEREGTVHAGGIVQTGNWVVPEPIADLIDTHLAPSALRKSTAWKMYRQAANLTLMARLGWSGFHLGFTTGDAVLSRAAAAGREASRGNLAGSAQALAHMPKAFAWFKDNPVLKEWFSPGTQGDDMAAIVKMLEMAGARARQPDLGTGLGSSWETFFRGLRQEGAKYPITHPFRTLGAGIEMGSRYVLNSIVPRQKFSVASELMRFELQNLQKETGAKNLTEAMEQTDPARLKQIAQRAWHSVDNRLGQIVYPNRFINNTLLDFLQGVTQSVGWNWGTIDELAGGVKDTRRLFSPEKDVSGQDFPRVTHRLAYALMLPFFHSLISMAVQYAYTGEGPRDFKDLMYPRNGRTNPDGTEQRVSPATYMKDVYAYVGGFSQGGPGRHMQHGINQFLQTIVHKMNPMLSMAVELRQNQNFHGTRIINPDDPLHKQIFDIAKFVTVGSNAPYSAQNYNRMRQSGATIAQAAPTFIGLGVAPASISRSPMQQALVEYQQEHMSAAPRTPEQAEQSDARKAIVGAARRADAPALEQAIVDARQKHLLAEKEISKLSRSTAQTSNQQRFKALPLPEAIRIFKLGDERERKEMAPFLKSKLQNRTGLDTVPLQKRIELLKEGVALLTGGQ